MAYVIRYDYELNRIKKKYKWFKKVGYTIKQVVLPDRLQVIFTNNEERIPCYFEFLDTRVICYGDYGSWIFEHYSSVDKKPINIPNMFINFNYWISKLDSCHKPEEYDDDRASEWIKNYIDSSDIDKPLGDYYLGDKLEADLNNYGCGDVSDAKEDLSNLLEDYCDYGYELAMSNNLKRFADRYLSLDFEDEYQFIDARRFNTYQGLLIGTIAMLQIIKEDYTEKCKDEM